MESKGMLRTGRVVIGLITLFPFATWVFLRAGLFQRNEQVRGFILLGNQN